MKKLLLILLLLVALVLGASEFTTDADWDKAPHNGQTLTFVCSVDTNTSATSEKFSLAKYDGVSFTTYPIGCGWTLTSTAAKPYVTAEIYGSMDGSNWFIVDTVLSNDSSEVATYEEIDLNNKKAVWYNLKITGQTGNRSDTEGELIFYFPEEE